MVTLGAILILLASQGGPETGVLFRKTTLSRSYGERFEERVKKEASKMERWPQFKRWTGTLEPRNAEIMQV